ncbi:hypothetical protein [Anaerospora hongkongensis]|uniref:hypothetical protein n=1 Tax=Anaerospora hongkongensis TaxID=244830 RepID=UPI00289B08B8|nr:hypothetical protein [Anaerospora hongkongensis]
MATAPVPPYKPTPPTPPVVPGSSAAHPAQPSQAAAATEASAAAGGSLQKFEDLGKAFQGQTAQPLSPAANTALPQETSPKAGQAALPVPAATPGTATEQTAAQTIQPAKKLPDPSSTGALYSWCLALVVIAALVLTGLHFFKSNRVKAPQEVAKKGKSPQPAAGMDITTASQDAPAKPKSSFEIRV